MQIQILETLKKSELYRFMFLQIYGYSGQELLNKPLEMLNLLSIL